MKKKKEGWGCTNRKDPSISAPSNNLGCSQLFLILYSIYLLISNPSVPPEEKMIKILHVPQPPTLGTFHSLIRPLLPSLLFYHHLSPLPLTPGYPQRDYKNRTRTPYRVCLNIILLYLSCTLPSAQFFFKTKRVFAFSLRIFFLWIKKKGGGPYLPLFYLNFWFYINIKPEIKLIYL